MPNMRGDSNDPAVVRREVERILTSKRFVEAPTLGQFLRFLVEHAIAGAPPLDERAIASQVFGRPENFVSELDPVVSVQYRRLRSALLAYYESEGIPTPVMLRTSDDGFGIVVEERAVGEAHRRRMPAKYVALAAFVVLAAGVAIWYQYKWRLAVPRAALQLDETARGLRAKGTQSDVTTSVHLFEQAVAIDSSYAPAWSGLADALIVPGGAGALSRTEALAKARDAAARAIELDPGIGQAHAALAYVRLFQDADWAGAEPEFRRAVQLDPSGPRIHRMYAQGLMSRGRFDEAIAQAKIAASLAPAGSPPSTDLPEILCAAHRYDEAIAEARRLVQQSGSSPGMRLALGITLSAAGHYDEAVEELQAAILVGHSAYALARLGYAYGAKGDRVAAESLLDRLNEAFTKMASINWSYRALVYAGMGDNQRALRCLESGLANQEGDLTFIGVDPAYDKLHADPRFLALKKRLGLP
jgi:tetratricopeptide (TPR) repeat protein